MAWGKILVGVAAYAIGGPIVGTAVVASQVAVSVSSKKSKEKGYQQGFHEAKMEDEETISEMEEFVRKAGERSRESKDRDMLIIALFAVGTSLANVDGEISSSEFHDLEEFITGAVWTEYPTHMKETILKLYNTPPTFNEAMEYVKIIENSNWELFDNLIDIIIASDGRINPNEVAYREAWMIQKRTWATV